MANFNTNLGLTPPLKTKKPYLSLVNMERNHVLRYHDSLMISLTMVIIDDAVTLT